MCEFSRIVYKNFTAESVKECLVLANSRKDKCLKESGTLLEEMFNCAKTMYFYREVYAWVIHVIVGQSCFLTPKTTQLCTISTDSAFYKTVGNLLTMDVIFVYLVLLRLKDRSFSWDRMDIVR